jgi:hypothetical protein
VREPIATFDEWTEHQLALKRAVTPPSAATPTPPLTGSYAGGNGEPTLDASTSTVLVSVPSPSVAGGTGDDKLVLPLPVAAIGSTLPASVDSAQEAAQAARRNYASKECGAKIVNKNAEAENAGAILNGVQSGQIFCKFTKKNCLQKKSATNTCAIHARRRRRSS